MAFVTPTDVATGEVLTASRYNQDVVENVIQLKTQTDDIGAVHVNTTTVSGASFVVNGCFTSTYANYLLIFDYYGSTAAAPNMRLRVSGTNSTSAYYSAGVLVRYDNETVTGVSANNSGEWSARLGHTDTGSTTRCQTTMTLTSPALAVNTTLTGMFNDARTAGGSAGGQFHGFHNAATAYDGFEFGVGMSLTGTVRVYGYRNT
jgi:hypothetical protein